MTGHHRRPSVGGVLGLTALTALTAGGYLYLRSTFGLSMWADALFFVALGIEVAHLGLSAVWWIYPPEEDDNDAVEAAFATVAAIFALLLGFVIVVAWEAYDATSTAVSKEANSIVELDRMVDGFDEDTAATATAAAKTYVDLVLGDEWEKMSSDGGSARADRALKDLWAVYTELPRVDRTSPLYAQSVARLVDLGDARRDRLDAASGSAVPRLLWVMLCVGAVLTVFLTYLFRVENTVLQRVLVTLVATVMVLALFLIGALEKPFDGKLPIRPDPLEQVRADLR